MRMKCLRILPEMWARTSWPLGRATRNMVPGNTWVTEPISSIGSSFARRMTLQNGTKAICAVYRCAERTFDAIIDAGQLPYTCFLDENRSRGIATRQARLATAAGMIKRGDQETPG